MQRQQTPLMLEVLQATRMSGPLETAAGWVAGTAARSCTMKPFPFGSVGSGALQGALRGPQRTTQLHAPLCPCAAPDPEAVRGAVNGAGDAVASRTKAGIHLDLRILALDT